MRRAGFGAPHDLLETFQHQTYEERVERLLDPQSQPDDDELTFFRYHPTADVMYGPNHNKLNWMYRMTHSQRYRQ